MAKDLENIKFGDFLPDFGKTVNTFIVSKVTNKYAYDTRVSLRQRYKTYKVDQ